MFENYINDQDMIKVWHEIDLVFDQMMTPELAGAAKEHGKYFKSGKGYFTSSYMAKFVLPTINSFAERVKFNGDHSVLVNYYGDGDYYHEHTDASIKTMVIFLSKGSNTFTGGDFRLSEINTTIPFKHNSCILFPSSMKHEVTTVHLNNTTPKMGRFSLTYFFK